MKAKDRDALLRALKARFEKNVHRHPGMLWPDVRARLEGTPDALRSLQEMEGTSRGDRPMENA